MYRNPRLESASPYGRISRSQGRRSFCRSCCCYCCCCCCCCCCSSLAHSEYGAALAVHERAFDACGLRCFFGSKHVEASQPGADISVRVASCTLTVGNVGIGEIGSTQSLHRATEGWSQLTNNTSTRGGGPEPRHRCFARDAVLSHHVACLLHAYLGFGDGRLQRRRFTRRLL